MYCICLFVCCRSSGSDIEAEFSVSGSRVEGIGMAYLVKGELVLPYLGRYPTYSG